MKALFIVLNQGEKIEEVADSLKRHGITSGSVIEAEGLHSNYDGIGTNPAASKSLLMMLSQGRPFHKIIFIILPDEKVPVAKAATREVVGDFYKDNVGIMFTLDVGDVEGLTHLDD